MDHSPKYENTESIELLEDNAGEHLDGRGYDDDILDIIPKT